MCMLYISLCENMNITCMSCMYVAGSAAGHGTNDAVPDTKNLQTVDIFADFIRYMFCIFILANFIRYILISLFLLTLSSTCLISLFFPNAKN